MTFAAQAGLTGVPNRPLPELWARAGWNPASDPIVVMRRSKRIMFSEFFMLLLPETCVTGLIGVLKMR